MDPYVKDPNSNHLLVGMGPICTTANLGDVVFNENYEDHNSVKAANDQSEKIPGSDPTFR